MLILTVRITEAFGLPKPSLFSNHKAMLLLCHLRVKLNSKRNRYNSHVLPCLLLIGCYVTIVTCYRAYFLLVVISHSYWLLLVIHIKYTLRKNA